jgi:hypothetical protein
MNDNGPDVFDLDTEDITPLDWENVVSTHYVDPDTGVTFDSCGSSQSCDYPRNPFL